MEITRLESILDESGKNYDREKIRRAYEYAAEAHKDQFRKSGEKYITHPVAVAEITAELGLDTDAICAALLHDTVEDCPGVNVDTIRAAFGNDVAELVDGLTKLVAIPFEDKEEEHIENLRKMFLAMSKDIRVILIKLCDRLHNMRTLSSHQEEKQRTIALETMHVYAPLAHRLGIQKIKQELESLALQYLDPIGYSEVQGYVEKKYGQNKDFIDRIRDEIAKKLEKQGLQFTIKGRVKTIYSIYRKMYRQNKSFDEIYDFYAVRIIVQTEMECYTVLGLIHEAYNSIPGRFKDYISTPKPNNYRSLHTTVIGRDGVPFEVQIRTAEMNEVAEYGIAAHWKYKSGVKFADDAFSKKLEWIHMLLESEQKSLDTDEFLSPLKVDIFSEETFVFTPKGDVVNLPSGANGIDFAYAIHSGVGNKMVGIKINGAIAPITTVLQTGQIVEVLTSSASKGPSRDWLKLATTGEAKNKIRSWYKKEKREENIQLAQEILNKEFDRLKKGLPEEERTQVMETIAKRFGLGSLDDLYNSIGYGGIAMSRLSVKIRDEIERRQPQEQKELVVTQTEAEKKIRKKARSQVIVEGLENCQIKFAKCCSPLPGDPIIGFITRGYGVSIHRYDCPNAKNGLSGEEKDRWINASWEEGADQNASNSYEANLTIITADNIGVMASISTALADMRVPVISISAQPFGENYSNINISVGTRNREHLSLIIDRLKKCKDVIRVTTGAKA